MTIAAALRNTLVNSEVDQIPWSLPAGQFM
jgi:hypothetical protein